MSANRVSPDRQRKSALANKTSSVVARSRCASLETFSATPEALAAGKPVSGRRDDARRARDQRPPRTCPGPNLDRANGPHQRARTSRHGLDRGLGENPVRVRRVTPGRAAEAKRQFGCARPPRRSRIARNFRATPSTRQPSTRQPAVPGIRGWPPRHRAKPQQDRATRTISARCRFAGTEVTGPSETGCSTLRGSSGRSGRP